MSGTELRTALRRCTERVHLVRGRDHDSGAEDPFLGLAASWTVASDGGSPRFTSRETDGGLLVVADLRGVTRDDTQTEVDLVEDSLILTVGNRFVWRVPVDDDRSSITDVSLNNDILAARVEVADYSNN